MARREQITICYSATPSSLEIEEEPVLDGESGEKILPLEGGLLLQLYNDEKALKHSDLYLEYIPYECIVSINNNDQNPKFPGE